MSVSVKKKSKTRHDLSETLLDIAEHLFAVKGYHGVSIRDVTSQAGAAISSINYHFGNKEQLFYKVLRRRALAISDRRVDMLNTALSAEAQSYNRLELIIYAYLSPLVERAQSDDKGWQSYLVLIAQVAQDQEFSRNVVKESYDPTARLFIEAIHQELQDAKHEDVIYAFVFLIGALLHTFAQTGRLDSLSQGKQNSSDVAKACDQMVPFFAAGLLSLKRNHVHTFNNSKESLTLQSH